MKIRTLLAATAAVALTFGGMPIVKMSPSGGMEFTTNSSAAYAKGNKGERIWMTGASREEIVAAFLRGDEPCVGSKQNHTCYNYDPVLQSLHIQQVSRPEGLNKNVTTNRDVVLDGSNVVMRTENGTPVLMFQVASEQQNAAAVWNTALANVPAAAFNGVGAAAIQAAFPSCGGNGCGGSGVINVVTASSGSIANAAAAIETTNAGGTGPCTTCTPRPHP